MTLTRYLFSLLFICTCGLSSAAAQKMKQLIWADEFDYNGQPDSSKWSYETGYIRNQELQYYTKRKENVRVEDGYLKIEARLDSSITPEGNIAPITSASIHTKNKGEWTYGRIEVRAKIPSMLGSWPAIWMLGNNARPWPACGEIDIMEHVGFMPDSIFTTVHTQAYNHMKGTHKGKGTLVSKPDNDFHQYRVDWTRDRLEFYIDNRKVFTFANEHTGLDTWPFDSRFYLILNLAIGGSWGGQKGVQPAALPQTFLIDYVRVYQ